MRPNLWQKGAVFASFVGCCLIVALLCSSLATDYWVASDASHNRSVTGSVHFGLVNGEKVLQQALGGVSFDIRVVCLEDQCMYSCGASADDRRADITDLLRGDGRHWNQSDHCAGRSVTAGRLEAPAAPPLVSLLRVQGARLPALSSASARRPTVTEAHRTEPEFMSRGLWIATLVMMGCSIAMVLVAAMFAILNTATNPVETVTGVVGLYLWNGVAMLFELLVLILWGVQFHQHLQHSVLWREEKRQQWSTDGLASLGYSYWLVFVALLLHAVNMAVLWFGTHQKRPKKVQIPVERGNASATNMIF